MFELEECIHSARLFVVRWIVKSPSQEVPCFLSFSQSVKDKNFPGQIQAEHQNFLLRLTIWSLLLGTEISFPSLTEIIKLVGQIPMHYLFQHPWLTQCFKRKSISLGQFFDDTYKIALQTFSNLSWMRKISKLLTLRLNFEGQ